jgi:hypothetical protein
VADSEAKLGTTALAAAPTTADPSARRTLLAFATHVGAFLAGLASLPRRCAKESVEQDVDLRSRARRATSLSPDRGRPSCVVPSSAVLRIAHVSDLHVLPPLGGEWRRALFDLYTMQNGGEVSSSKARVLDPATLALVRRGVPAAAGAA